MSLLNRGDTINIGRFDCIIFDTNLTKMAAMTLDDVLIYLGIFSYLFQIVHWAEIYKSFSDTKLMNFVKEGFRVIMFNSTFNNISTILWQSVLYAEEVEYPEKIFDLSKLMDKLLSQCCIEYTLPWTGFDLTTLVVIGTDSIGSCDYHTITTKTPLC